MSSTKVSKANFYVELDYTSNADVSLCIARAHLVHPHTGETLIYTTTGTAKRFRDRFDGEVAFKLAAGRALLSLGKRLLKQGNGRVKCNDDNGQRRHLVARSHDRTGRPHQAPRPLETS
jgi:ribosomal protein L31